MRNIDKFRSNKLLLGVSVAAISIFSAAAHADSIDHTINISGTSAESCSIPEAQTHGADLGELTNGIDGTLVPRSTSVNIGQMSCNYGIVLALRTENGALTRTEPAVNLPANFADAVQYTATVNWGGSSFALTTDGNAQKKTNSTLGPRNNDLIVNIAIISDQTKKLFSGNYSDILILRIGAVL